MGDETSKNLFGISIHAPRAGSDVKGYAFKVDIAISIHAPRAGSDRNRLIHL